MTELSYDAMVRQMVAMRVPRKRAEAVARAAIKAGAPESLPPQPNPEDGTAAIVWPVTVMVPWSLLVSDNEKYGVANGRMILRQTYREAKRDIRRRARESVGGGAIPARVPVRLVAAVYVPDRRIHDVVNFAKCTHDALEQAVYESDRWLEDARWFKAGVDVDAPRAEITITPIPEGTL